MVNFLNMGIFFFIFCVYWLVLYKNDEFVFNKFEYVFVYLGI